ncbi:MAG: helicase HerA-like domain-containing protein [Chitinophagaceae bacterium]
MSFQETIQSAYTFKGESAYLGIGMLDGQAVENASVHLPLKTMNRHGLIAGATGTGKTKTLQVLAECLSDASIPVMLMDIKGDLSGIGAAGTANDKINERCQIMNIAFKASAYPIEFLTLSDEPGTRLRATVSEFGPVLFSKILGLNETQEGIISMLFKYCDDKQLPLLDLKDIIKVLQYISNEGKDELKETYGTISTQSTGTILQKIIELQQQKADIFFGEKSFEVEDLMRISDDGRGLLSIVRVTDLQDRPKLFSTFMLQLLAELYASMPEAGDLEKPTLVLFIDEAHLIFQDASKALLQQLETVIKLIRSKGVGIFFITQNPTDIPQSILGQLGLKVQHALRAFTAKDRQDIKKIAQNYPETEYYKTEDLITQLGIGEAFVTLLNEKGIPTPLVHTLLRPPYSRMDILQENEIQSIIAQSKIASKYNVVIDSKSAYELLNEKLASANEEEEPKTTTSSKKEKGTLETILDNPVTKQVGRTAASIITRSLLGVLGLGGTTRKRKTKSWF